MTDTKPQAQAESSAYIWLVLALAFTSFIMSFSTRYVWPPLMPVVMPILDITRTEGMLYMTAFFVGYVTMQIPGGIMSDRFGARRVLATTLLVQGTCTCLLSLTSSYHVGLALRLATGLAGGSVFSSTFKAVVTWFPPEKRSLGIGVLLAGPSVGVALPNIVVPRLNIWLGWQGSFLAVGLAAIFVAALVFFFLRDVKTQAGPKKSFMVGVRFVLRNRNMIIISLADFWIIFIQLAFYSLCNIYIVDRMLAADPSLERNQVAVTAGLVMFYVGIVGMIMPAFSGWLAGKTGKPKWNFIVGALLIVPMVIIFGKVDGYAMWMTFGVGVGALIAFVNPMFSVIIAENAGPRWAATAGGIGNCWLQIGGMFGPLVMGLARDWTGEYSLCWIILAVAGLIAAILCSMLGKSPTTEEQDAMIADAENRPFGVSAMKAETAA